VVTGEIDTIIGKNGKGGILTLTECKTGFLLMEKLSQGKQAVHLAKVLIRKLLPYKIRYIQSPLIMGQSSQHMN
jgi:IS30 family transposase